PLGRTWNPTQRERRLYKEVQPLVSNPWAVLHPGAPSKSKPESLAIDLHKPGGKRLLEFREADRERVRVPHTNTAWRGTLRSSGDADLWLALAFPAYERHVALERALLKRAGEKELSARDRDRLAVSLGRWRAFYEQGARARTEPALAKIKRSFRHSDWARV